MKRKNLNIIIALLLVGCSSQPIEPIKTTILDGSNVDQSVVKIKGSNFEIEGVKIEQASAQKIGANFKLLSTDCGLYAASEKGLYYFERTNDDEYVMINLDNSPLPSAKDFSAIGNCYFKNTNHIIYEGKEMKEADMETFEPFENKEYPPHLLEFASNRHARDKNHIYFKGEVIPGADPNTYQILSNHQAKDKNAMYLGMKRVENSDPETFQALEGGYAQDKNHVYYFEKFAVEGGVWGIIPADIESFQVIDDAWARDEKKVFVRGKAIPNADPKTFQPLGDYYFGYYSKDAYSVFYEDEKIEGADPVTFTMEKDVKTPELRTKD